MKLTITGNTYVLTSTIKAEDIELLNRYNPDALSVKDKEGNVKFKISYSEDRTSITPFGITFGCKSRGDDEGYATAMVPIPSGLSTEKAKEFVVDSIGSILGYIEQVEDNVTKEANAVKTQRKELIEKISTN